MVSHEVSSPYRTLLYHTYHTIHTIQYDTVPYHPSPVPLLLSGSALVYFDVLAI